MLRDSEFQQLSSVQNGAMLPPATIASATTIAPTTRMSLITGTADVETITPPVAGHHELVLVFTNGSPGDILDTGNITTAGTPVTDKAVLLEYEPAIAKYYIAGIVTS